MILRFFSTFGYILVTSGYTVLQMVTLGNVTGGYTGLQVVTLGISGYTVLQMVTLCYRWLHCVTDGYTA